MLCKRKMLLDGGFSAVIRGWRHAKEASSYGSNGHTAVVVYPPSTAMIWPVM